MVIIVIWKLQVICFNIYEAIKLTPHKFQNAVVYFSFHYDFSTHFVLIVKTSQLALAILLLFFWLQIDDNVLVDKSRYVDRVLTAVCMIWWGATMGRILEVQIFDDMIEVMTDKNYKNLLINYINFYIFFCNLSIDLKQHWSCKRSLEKLYIVLMSFRLVFSVHSVLCWMSVCIFVVWINLFESVSPYFKVTICK